MVDSPSLDLLGLLARSGGGCAVSLLLGTVLGAAAGLAGAAALSVGAARPALRWGFGGKPALSCLAAVLLAAGGVVGVGTAGLWLGGGHCLNRAVADRYLLEDLALGAVLTAARSAPGAPDDDAAALSRWVERLGGSLRAAAADLDREELPEGLAALRAVLSPERLARLAEIVESNHLLDPPHLAEVAATGGFAAAARRGPEGTAAFARRMVAATAEVRDQVGAGVAAVVVPNAVGSALLGLGVPLVLVILVAGAGRLAGEGTRRSRMLPEERTR